MAHNGTYTTPGTTLATKNGAFTDTSHAAVMTSGTYSSITRDSPMVVPYHASLNPASFTIEMWIRILSPMSGLFYLAECATVSSGFEFFVDAGNGKLRSTTYGGSAGFAQSFNGALIHDKLHHVACSVGPYGGGQNIHYLYVDGQVVAGSVIPASRYIPNTTRDLAFGGKPGTLANTNGSQVAISYPALYNSALADATILAHYNAGIGPNEYKQP